MGEYAVKKTNTGFKFDLKAGNGEVIANSEVYSSKAACLKGIRSVMINAPVVFWHSARCLSWGTQSTAR